MVPFGGWDMPVEYSGIVDEHMAVRDARRAVRRQPHGRDRDRRQGRARGRPAASRRNDAVEAAASARRSTPALTTPAGHVRRRRAGVPAGRRALPARGQRRRNIDKDYELDRRARSPAVGDAVGRQRQLALRAASRCRGRRRMRRAADAHRRRPRRRSSTTGSRTARSPASAARSRAPATPARTASRCSCRPHRPSACGSASSQAGKPAGRRARAASARATRCASKRRCACTATTSTRRRPCSKRISAGSSAGRRTTSSARTCCAQQKADGVARKLVGFEMLDRGIARHGYTVLRRRRAGRRRDERHADAVPEEGDRHGVRAGRARPRAGTEFDDRHPRPPRAARRSCRCRSTSGRSSVSLTLRRDRWRPMLSGRSEVHERPRVDQRRPATRGASASPTTRSSSSATSSTSSCPRSGATLTTGDSRSARSNR